MNFFFITYSKLTTLMTKTESTLAATQFAVNFSSSTMGHQISQADTIAVFCTFLILLHTGWQYGRFLFKLSFVGITSYKIVNLKIILNILEFNTLDYKY